MITILHKEIRILDKFLFIALMSPGCLFIAPHIADAAIKCWVNSDGIRECGQRVPPEYSQKGHETINKQGVTINKESRVKTLEERKEEERLAKIKALKEEEKARQAIRDRTLLGTYSSTDDIKLDGDQKIADVESLIKLTKKRNSKIQAELDKRNAMAKSAEGSGAALSKDLVEDIKSLERQLKNNELFINSKRAEQKNIEKEYAEKAQRFLQLTGKGN